MKFETEISREHWIQFTHAHWIFIYFTFSGKLQFTCTYIYIHQSDLTLPARSGTAPLTNMTQPWIPKTWAHTREFWAGVQEGCQSIAVFYYYRINYSTIILGECMRAGLVGTPPFFKVLSCSIADAVLKPMSLPNGTNARIKCHLTDGSAVFVKKALHLTILKADSFLHYSFTASQLHFIWTIHLVLKPDL